MRRHPRTEPDARRSPAVRAVCGPRLRRPAKIIGARIKAIDELAVAIVLVNEEVVVVNQQVEQLARKFAGDRAAGSGVLTVIRRIDADPSSEFRANQEAKVLLAGEFLDDAVDRVSICAADLDRTVKAAHGRTSRKRCRASGTLGAAGDSPRIADRAERPVYPTGIEAPTAKYG